MLIDDYIKGIEKSDAEVADELSVTPECVRLWRRGMRMPRPEAMVLISQWSGGKVTADDFYRAKDAAA